MDETTYKDFGTYPGVQLNIPNPPKGRFPLLKTVNEAFTLAAEELRLEKEKQAQDEQDKENEIIPQETDGKGSQAKVTFVVGLLTLPFLLFL